MFNMLTIGKKAVAITEKQLEVTGHNIANENTPGYSRQRVVQEAADPLQLVYANIGTGVNLVRVERMRDLYLDAEFRKQYGNTGYWGSMTKNLQELEKNVIETSEHGINQMINNFFNDWEFLSNNPFSTIHRMDVVNSTEQMIRGFQDLYRSIEDKIQDVKYQMMDSAQRINEIAVDLANIMDYISYHKVMETPINDVMDKFDLLIDELSNYGDVTIKTRDNGTMSVYFGTVELVRNNEPQTLIIEDRVNSMTDETEFFISWDNIKNDVNSISGLTTGSIKALYDLKDKILPSYLEKLDQMVVEIADQVNAIHTLGYNLTDPTTTGYYFFDPNTKGVKSFSLSKEVLADPGFIATSLTGASGDNQISLMITDLRKSQTFGNEQTLTESFADLVYVVASDVKFSITSADRSQLISDQTDNFREAVKGVSINEESANLVKYQAAYQAAAKIITVADEMLKTIINMV